MLRRWRKRESDLIEVGTGEDQRLFSESGMKAIEWERLLAPYSTATKGEGQ